ncbi:MAG: hypothetical protein OXF61_11075, partial [Acidimicrobiaceae bacterium]|nr:hypothetical protein [Acidimicrobiaceae bacterium]
MSSGDIRSSFDGRCAEVLAYLELVRTVETATRSGPPTIGIGGASISPLQQRILYANVFVHLYNLVEATITRCLSEIQEATCNPTTAYTPADLSFPVLR